MKKIFIFVLIVLLSSLSLLGCGENKIVEEEPFEEELDYEYYYPDDIDPEDLGGVVIVQNKREAKFKTINIYDTRIKEISSIKLIEPLTGEYSPNQTRSKYGVVNGDIGVSAKFNDKIYFFFGDTTIDYKNGSKRSFTNVAAYTTDVDYRDGIDLDGYISDDNGFARVLVERDGNEARTRYNQLVYEGHKIPTGAIQIGDTFYMMYMSVRQFTKNNNPDDWDCNYGGLAKSTDGINWEDIKTYKTEEDEYFIQNYPVYNEEDGFVYVFGHGEGRFKPAQLARVKAEDFEDLDKYEYLTGYDSNNNPIWGGSWYATNLIDAYVWEHSVMYNEYLGKWIFAFGGGSTMYLYTAKNIYGPYELGVEIKKPEGLGNWYSFYMNPTYTRMNGKKMAFQTSFMESLSGGVWMVCTFEITFLRQ